MEIHKAWHDSCLICTVTGDLAAQGLAEVFYETVVSESGARASEVIIDLSGADVPGSRFIARLVDIARLMHDSKVKVGLRIVNNPTVCDVVTMFSLDRIFDSVSFG